MSDHLLTAIIALEKELQAQIQAELSRATAWRERQLATLAEEEQQMRAALANVRAEQLEAARRAAVASGEQTLAAAQLWCARLADLPEELCAAHLAPLLRGLLPEAGDDHAHGQN